MYHLGNVRLLGQVDGLLFLDVHRLWDVCFASPWPPQLWHEPVSGVRREGKQEVVSLLPALSVAGVFPVSLFQAEKKELGRVDFGRKAKTGKYSLLLDEL